MSRESLVRSQEWPLCGLVSLLLCVEEYRLATNYTNSHKRIQIKYELELPAAMEYSLATDEHRLAQITKV